MIGQDRENNNWKYRLLSNSLIYCYFLRMTMYCSLCRHGGEVASWCLQ